VAEQEVQARFFAQQHQITRSQLIGVPGVAPARDTDWELARGPLTAMHQEFTARFSETVDNFRRPAPPARSAHHQAVPESPASPPPSGSAVPCTYSPPAPGSAAQAPAPITPPYSGFADPAVPAPKAAPPATSAVATPAVPPTASTPLTDPHPDPVAQASQPAPTKAPEG
jgi:hypothetical protein